jgi:transcriptional regulator with XRE-family HTH domain
MGVKRRKQPKHLAAKLKELRNWLEVSQAQMAILLKEPDPGVISRYEHGEREPSLITLLEYARLGRISMEVLVDDNLKLPHRRSR